MIDCRHHCIPKSYHFASQALDANAHRHMLEFRNTLDEPSSAADEIPTSLRGDHRMPRKKQSESGPASMASSAQGASATAEKSVKKMEAVRQALNKLGYDA